MIKGCVCVCVCVCVYSPCVCVCTPRMCVCVCVCVCMHTSIYPHSCLDLDGLFKLLTPISLQLREIFFNYLYLITFLHLLFFFFFLTFWSLSYFPVNPSLRIFNVAFLPSWFLFYIFPLCFEVCLPFYILVQQCGCSSPPIQQLNFSFRFRKSFLCCTWNSLRLFLSHVYNFRKESIFWEETYSPSQSRGSMVAKMIVPWFCGPSRELKGESGGSWGLAALSSHFTATLSISAPFKRFTLILHFLLSGTCVSY